MFHGSLERPRLVCSNMSCRLIHYQNRPCFTMTTDADKHDYGTVRIEEGRQWLTLEGCCIQETNSGAQVFLFSQPGLPLVDPFTPSGILPWKMRNFAAHSGKASVILVMCAHTSLRSRFPEQDEKRYRSKTTTRGDWVGLSGLMNQLRSALWSAAEGAWALVANALWLLERGNP